MVRQSQLFVAIAAVTVVCAVPAQAAPVVVELRAERAELTTADDVYVRFNVRNADTRARDILLWHTPFGAEIDSNLFVVTRDGAPVAYLGALAKRGAPEAEDFARLAPGRSLKGRVELTSLYDMSQPGTYEISYRGAIRDLVPSETGAAMLPSNTVRIDVTGDARPSDAEFMKAMAEAAAVASLSYTKCTATQQTGVAQAVAAASAYADEARSVLASGATGARFTTWFKATSNLSRAASNFFKIDEAFDTKPVVVDCGCKKKYYAYVYPAQAYKIYVCRAFWSAPVTGTDSRGGTLIHEMSHFDVVAGTDDIAYGQAACKNLTAAQAIINADTHEYYAENTPRLAN
jgi:peptidyl-Lys metalloendopeptidase